MERIPCAEGRTMNGVEEPAGGGATDFETGRALWQRCRTAESVEDETEYFLDLAGFADGMLADDDERARVAARLAQDAAARSDVAAACRCSATWPSWSSGRSRLIHVANGPRRRHRCRCADAGCFTRLRIGAVLPRRLRSPAGSVLRWAPTPCST